MLMTSYYCHILLTLMLKICEQFALVLDVKSNSSKSMIMRIGERFNVKCAPLTLDDCELQFVTMS